MLFKNVMVRILTIPIVWGSLPAIWQLRYQQLYRPLPSLNFP